MPRRIVVIAIIIAVALIPVILLLGDFKKFGIFLLGVAAIAVLQYLNTYESSSSSIGGVQYFAPEEFGFWSRNRRWFFGCGFALLIGSVIVGAAWLLHGAGPFSSRPPGPVAFTIPRDCEAPSLRFSQASSNLEGSLLCENNVAHSLKAISPRPSGFALSSVDAGITNRSLNVEIVSLTGAFYTPYSTSDFTVAPLPGGSVVRWQVPHDDDVGFEYIRPPFDVAAPILRPLFSVTRWPWFFLAGAGFMFSWIWTEVLSPLLADRVKAAFQAWFARR